MDEEWPKTGIGMPPSQDLLMSLPFHSSARSFLLAAGFCVAGFAFAGEAPAKVDDVDSDPDIQLAVSLERAFEKVSQRVAPSVVNLDVTVKARGNWNEELKKMSEPHQMVPERQYQGSGVIVDTNGFIVTNEHVVRNAETIRVKLYDGRNFAAKVCGTDPRSDLAMIQLTGDVPKDLKPAVFGDSDTVKVGQWTLAIGNPFGLNNTVSVGVVSARGRSMLAPSLSNDVFYGNMIQTAAEINPGNSGGPLFDIRGRLVGINTMIFSKSGVSEGYGFAIPANHLQKRVAYLKSGREVEYGWLGVRLDDLDPGQREFDVPDNKGARVEMVIPNTPADRAGLEQGMVILEFNGVRVANTQELIREVNETPVGRSVKLKALNRSGKIADYSVKVSKRNAEFVRASMFNRIDDENEAPEVKPASASADPKDAGTFWWRGLRVKELTEEDGKKRGGRLEIVTVRKGSPADRAGLYEGAILTELKHSGNPAIQSLSTIEDLKKASVDVKGAAALHLTLDGYVTVDEK